MSPTDLAISKELRGRGIKAEPRQIERARDAGLTPRTIRKGLGRGRGTISRYPDGALDQIAAAFKLKEKYRRLQDVLCVLFYRGYDVDEEKLRRALTKAISQERDFVNSIAEADNPDEEIESKAQQLRRQASRRPQGKRWGRRLRGRGDSSSSILDGVFSVLLRTLTGQPFSSEGKEELLDATAFSSMDKEVLEGIGPMVSKVPEDAFAKAALTVDPNEVLRVVQERSYDELKATRDRVRFIFETIEQFHRFVSRAWKSETSFGVVEVALMPEIDVAYSIPAFVLAFDQLGSSADTWIAELEPELAKYRGLNVLLDHLPERFWRHFRSEVTRVTLTDDEGGEFEREINRIRNDHPEVGVAIESELD